MPALLTLEPGMFTTVQDLGRSGFSASGVASGGAADAISLRVCNRVLDNAENAAGLECTLIGSSFRAEGDTWIAISAGFPNARVITTDDSTKTLDPWMPVKLGHDEQLHLGPIAGRSRGYLCVAGGLAIGPVMGSASTHVPGGFGGFEGRPLRAGDRLEVAPAQRPVPKDSPRAAITAFLSDPLGPRVLAAIDTSARDGFSPESVRSFWTSTFIVGRRSDRVGVRLEGHLLAAPAGGRLISRGVPAGAVQIPENGKPIVLGVDHPTTGGYPVIACIAGVDLDNLGRCTPGEKVSFRPVSVDQARATWRQREEQLARIFGGT